MKHSLKDGSGYLIIDHTDSPGIKPEEVPARLRDTTITVKEGKKFEADILHCSHCQRALMLNPMRTRARGYCSKCDHYICDLCSVNPNCNSFKKLLDTLINQTEKKSDIILTDNI